MPDSLIFLIDDDNTLRTVLSRELSSRGFEVNAFPSTEGVLEAIEEKSPQIVLLDMRLPGEDGMKFLQRLRDQDSDLQVVVLTGHGSVEQAVQAMRLGAQDFLTKPVRLDLLEQTIRRVAERGRLVSANTRLRRAASAAAEHRTILGRSAAIRDLLENTERVAASDSSVLILGENGTGKELVARYVHQLSRRSEQPFVVLDCAAIPKDVVESELFGHEKGSFTGADKQRLGLFEAADGGTLFLDELGDLPPAIQPALLRALQFGEIRRVGSHRTRKVDVRFVAASNRPILDMLTDGEFREDLYYRIATLQLEVPPLRERPEDIEELAREFFARAVANTGRNIKLHDSAISRLRAYSWPGNVRELENAMVRLVVMCNGDSVDAECVDQIVLHRPKPHGELPTLDLRELERLAIDSALKRVSGDKRAAARELGIAPTTLYSKLDKHDLK